MQRDESKGGSCRKSLFSDKKLGRPVLVPGKKIDPLEIQERLSRGPIWESKLQKLTSPTAYSFHEYF